MSFFLKACAIGLMERPVVNAMIDAEKNEVVYRDFCDISVAMSAPKGLVTPVIRNVQAMSFAEIEQVVFSPVKIQGYGRPCRKSHVRPVGN
jgi:2-oxoglutarate dehydrogenase E2 component (dihydrolipoamide succinyltransferase)